MASVAKVWIDEDCITCDACQDICPEVFEVTDESSYILAAVRTDGVFDRNVGGAPLVGTLGAELGDIIIEAAEACPVEVIKYELVTDAAAEAVAEAAPVEVEAAAPAAAAAVAPAAGVSDALNAVFAGDRSINILFGSQTGNAAGLAEKTAKLASNYGLEPNIVDMDGFDPARLATMKRVMIIT
ncbi:MAG: ferredoxin, partial [Candidatus Thermoplasmatota archaeon]|nr:ferredoxin [Candidatus Thermoplasmatota archaeon]